ncbi:MAG: ABC transporter ATP-binding protein [Nitrososphaerota archaeon]|nr:ABC transporter ATP-binding protein [Nitrososphaerota archaeon]
MADILSVKNVDKNFGRTRVLSGVSFGVESGEAVLLLGPNGAGKTTIIKCILGLLNFNGSIMVDGIDVKSKGNLARAEIGYLPQLSSYYETLTIEQHARLMASLKGASRDEIERSLEIAGLQDVRNRMVKALSSGMRQRLGLSIALLGNPPLLILDEPTSNIDLEGQLEFKRMLQRLKEAGKAFLISTHLSGLDLIADEVVVLNAGKVVATGSSSEILQRLGLNDKMYLKVSEAQVSLVKEVANGLGGVPEFKDGWLVLPVSPSNKATFLEELLKRGVKINDLVVEQFSIESEYVKLLQVNQQ